jgi:transposase
VRARAADLDRQLLSLVRENAACRQLMTIPGVGAVVALSFVIETPETFTRSRDVGAWMTPRRYQSGEVDYEGHISRRGDARLRSLLYEAAMAILTRVRGESELRSWALALRRRLGFKRAAVALARKLAVIMHAMLKTGTDFDPKPAARP